MRVKITDAQILLQPESPQDLIQICSMMGDGKSRSVRVDPEAAKVACFTAGATAIDGGLAKACEAANLGTQPPPADLRGSLDRNTIKAELDKLGIEYNNRWGTGRLAAFLAEKRGPAPGVVTPVPDAPAAPSVGDPAPAVADADPFAETKVTKDDVMQALKKIVATKGKEEGIPLVKKILTDHNASNISGITEEQYASVMQAVQAVS